MNRNARNLMLVVGSALVLGVPGVGFASSVAQDLVDNAKISGDVRLYNWNDINRYSTNVDNNTFSLGGKLVVQSGSYHGFSAVLGFYGAHSLGLNETLPYTPTPVLVAPNGAKVNPTLAPSINVVGQAYVQWKNDNVSIRVGNQPLETPFANSADYRMVPLLYQGIVVDFKPSKNLELTAARIYKFKDWVSSDFTKTNSYIWFGDTRHTNGSWLVGAKLNQSFGTTDSETQAWLYKFYDYANLGYLTETLHFNREGEIKPFAGIEVIKERGSGRKLFGDVDSNWIGGNIGADYRQLQGRIAIVHIAQHSGAYNNGGLVSPYTNFYGSAPIYTQSPEYSTEAFGAGNAYQAQLTWTAMAQLQTSLTYTYYSMTNQPGTHNNNVSEWYGVVSYSFDGSLKGLSIMDILSVGTPRTAATRTFTQNRLMVQYSF